MNAADLLEAGNGEVVPSVSIDALIRHRDGIIQRMQAARSMLAEAEQISDAAGFTTDYARHEFAYVLCGDNHYRHHHILEAEAPEHFRRRLDALGWDLLMKESGLRTFMDATARKEWDEKISSCATPELTLPNIQATFSDLYAGRADMFDRGVIQCFKRLSWDYKTNNPFRLGKRIVIYLGPSMSWDGLSNIGDLQRVFCILDGKPEEDHRSGLATRLQDAKRAPNGGNYSRGEHDDIYMSVRWFKNGNAHITFKFPKLVDRLNEIIAKHFPGALPAPRVCQ